MPVLLKINSLGLEDWDYFSFANAVQSDTIYRYNQFPFWNPYATGGRPLLANPQAAVLSPNFIITLILGCVIGLKIQVFLMIFAGMIGMFLLSKYYKINPIAGILSASIFGMSGFFSLRIYAGHFNFLLFNLVPFILLFFLKSFENKKYIALSALALAWIILDIGLVHAIPAVLIFFSFYALLLSIQKKSFRPVIYMVIIFIFAVGISAIRILPTYGLVSVHPRGGDPGERTSIYSFYHMLLDDKLQAQDEYGQAKTFWRWHEYASYVGILPLILFIIGIFVLFIPQFPLILSGLLMFIISLGGFSKYSPWTLMHKLPFLSSLHISTRFMVLFIFVLALIVGILIDKFWKNSDKKYLPPKCLLFLVSALIIVDLILVNTPLFYHFPNNIPPNLTRNDTFTQVDDHAVFRSGALSSMYYNFLENKGTWNGYDPLPYDNYAKPIDNKDYKGEVYLVNGEEAYYSYWSPNKLIVNFSTPETTHLVINQNYAKDWKIKGKNKVENYNGLLSTNVNPEEKQVIFYYLPNSFIYGGIISVVFILGIILLWFKIPKFLRKY
jgi:hypothetical protein